MEYPKEYAEKLAAEYGHTLDAQGNVTSPGKFEGETWRTIDAYDTLQNGCEDESFGDANEGNGFYFAAQIETGETVYCEISPQGFVSELTERSFRALEKQEQEASERDEAIGEISSEIMAMEMEEQGPCDSCQVAMINGVRCHEHGCPRAAKLKEMQHRLESLQEY